MMCHAEEEPFCATERRPSARALHSKPGDERTHTRTNTATHIFCRQILFALKYAYGCFDE